MPRQISHQTESRILNSNFSLLHALPRMSGLTETLERVLGGTQSSERVPRRALMARSQERGAIIEEAKMTTITIDNHSLFKWKKGLSESAKSLLAQFKTDGRIKER